MTFPENSRMIVAVTRSGLSGRQAKGNGRTSALRLSIPGWSIMGMGPAFDVVNGATGKSCARIAASRQ